MIDRRAVKQMFRPLNKPERTRKQVETINTPPDYPRAIRWRMKLSESLQKDRKGSWNYFGAPLSTIENQLNFRIRKEIKQRLTRAENGKKVMVLDYGCGNARALSELKAEFGGRIFTTGTILKKPNPKELEKTKTPLFHDAVDRIIEGDFLTTRVPGKYDLIFSHYGPAIHGQAPVSAIEKAITMLKPGGVAAIHFLKSHLGFGEELNAMLIQNGISPKDYRLVGNEVIIITKPVRKLP
ncbi:Uncharacterised protein [uncultured archaeon]|nr:Uncharacterised protein [uncultured archaeon]